MDLDDLIGPLPAPLGRWMLRRLVASGVRYGHEFAILLVRGADWDGGDLLALLPDTDRAGAQRVAERVREHTGGHVGAAHWGGDLAEDLVERALRALEADIAQPA